MAGREAGADALYVGDHHAEPDGYLQNNVILGRLLAEWPRDVGSIYLLPLWHPIFLAEQVGSLAELARGRFVVQAALGYGQPQFAAMGVAMRERVSRFESGFDIVQRLLRGEEVSADGPFPISAARVPSHHNVVYWVAGHSDPALQRAARHADGWIAGPGLTPAQAEERASFYRRACGDAGAIGEVAIRRDVYVAASEEDATRVSRLASGHRGLDPAALIIGEPGQVAGEMASLGQIGYTEVVFRQLVDDQTLALQSIGRLAAVRERLGG